MNCRDELIVHNVLTVSIICEHHDVENSGVHLDPCTSRRNTTGISGSENVELFSNPCVWNLGAELFEWTCFCEILENPIGGIGNKPARTIL